MSKIPPAPKDLYTVLKSYDKLYTEELSKTNKKDSIMVLKLFARHLKGKTRIVNKTTFKFDKEGIAEVVDKGHTRYDYEAFLKVPGIQPWPLPSVEKEIVKPEVKKVETKVEVPDTMVELDTVEGMSVDYASEPLETVNELPVKSKKYGKKSKSEIKGDE